MDGINVLREFCSDEKELIRRILCSILFFDAESVKQQTLYTKQQIEEGKAIPVRFTSNDHFYHQREVKKTTPSFKNRREAVQYTKDNPLFHKETGIRICFDNDGNYFPKKSILKYTGYRVSSGNLSTITNYTIAHIWGETDNPLYFGLLWNYCLVPAPFAFLTDKRDDSDLIVKRVKELIKAISIKLYNPDDFLKQWSKSVEMPSKEALKEAEQLIKGKLVKFVPKNNL